jgi:hypothetical protein
LFIRFAILYVGTPNRTFHTYPAVNRITASMPLQYNIIVPRILFLPPCFNQTRYRRSWWRNLSYLRLSDVSDTIIRCEVNNISWRPSGSSCLTVLKHRRGSHNRRITRLSRSFRLYPMSLTTNELAHALELCLAWRLGHLNMYKSQDNLEAERYRCEKRNLIVLWVYRVVKLLT